MGKAIEILEGGNDIFEGAHKEVERPAATTGDLFFQVSSNVQVEDQARSAAYSMLKALVKKGHGGLRLAFLAADLTTTTAGHFDDVIAQIDRMIAHLREEEQD